MFFIIFFELFFFLDVPANRVLFYLGAGIPFLGASFVGGLFFLASSARLLHMYGVFNTSLQGLWLHLATTKIFAWPHATLVFAGTPKDMLPQTQSAHERGTPSSAEYTEWLICPRMTGYVVRGLYALCERRTPSSAGCSNHKR